MKRVSILRHGSLFSGIGGFDLAAQWCGWRNVFHCEINEFCNRVLSYYWPKAETIKNIIGYEWKKWKGKIDVLSGGFPCQPYSVAGKRLGKADPRHLWPEMLRAIKEIGPSWVVAENVRGLISWSGGMVFDEVQSDLETAGYEVVPVLLPAAGINAPHKRERVWFIAHRRDGREPATGNIVADANNGQQPEQQKHSTAKGRKSSASRSGPQSGAGTGDICRYIAQRIRQLAAGAIHLQKASPHSSGLGCNHGSDNRKERQVQDNKDRISEKDQPKRKGRQRRTGKADPFSANTHSKGLERKTSLRIQAAAERRDTGQGTKPAWDGRVETWENFPETQPSVRIGDDGLPHQLDFTAVFEGIPFPIKPISFSKWRTESIKAYGNAIVPQIAYRIFYCIEYIKRLNKKDLCNLLNSL